MAVWFFEPICPKTKNLPSSKFCFALSPKIYGSSHNFLTFSKSISCFIFFDMLLFSKNSNFIALLCKNHSKLTQITIYRNTLNRALTHKCTYTLHQIFSFFFYIFWALKNFLSQTFISLP